MGSGCVAISHTNQQLFPVLQGAVVHKSCNRCYSKCLDFRPSASVICTLSGHGGWVAELSKRSVLKCLLQATDGFLFVAQCENGCIIYVSDSVTPVLSFSQVLLLLHLPLLLLLLLPLLLLHLVPTYHCCCCTYKQHLLACSKPASWKLYGAKIRSVGMSFNKQGAATLKALVGIFLQYTCN